MISFLTELKNRNKAMYYFGLLNLITAIVCLFLMIITDTLVLGINSWIKPFKFFLSSVIFCWSMGWYLSYLKKPTASAIYSWVVILVFLFENIYIIVQAAKGEKSHFNISSSFHSIMFMLMGIMISIMTLWTAYIGVLFFVKKFPDLPKSYLWGIRLGILTFVIFAFEGGVMGATMAHTVGGKDGGDGLMLVNWSTEFGDLRIAHFLGMHSLQIFPLVGFYLIKKLTPHLLFMLIYFVACSLVLYQAISGNPLIGLGGV